MGEYKISEQFRDIIKWFPDYAPEVMFDVGANVGQTCLSYARIFPTAQIHAFEPVPAAFEQLKANIGSASLITPWLIALSSSSGRVTMRAKGASTGNRILPRGAPKPAHAATVTTITGIEFCVQQQIRTISYLKIDTEGHDLEVLRGFEGMLDRIEFVQVEASANRYNTKHVLFKDLEEFLSSHGFWLFKHYEQKFEFFDGGKPVLRRTNPVFINEFVANVRGLRKL